MEQLRKAIEEQGVGIGRDIVKVDMFLNHRIDTGLLFSMGEAWAEEFRDEQPDLVLTVEASGIAMAVAAAHALGDIPVVFAKKSATVVQNDAMVQAPVYSFTHKTQNSIRIDRRYLPEGSRVLIIDDFLADGEAVKGMMSLCEQQKAQVVGVGIAVEKGFQPGGRKLREAGVHLKSLAIVEEIRDGKLILRAE
ncbi:MAG: xanthine phosphoribosyltransferase [Clostridia bacterium]|nr:xanthine phosphoribosyltransferase [Clostridia bacterium]MBR7174538.1 xanthine phosphoribosyltransferase [Clostridia bacterium]